MIVHPNCFASVRGQSVAVETLRRAIDKDQVHHAYRFEGLAGVGKERTAFAFARALLCERGGCGRCDVCDRLVVREGEAVPRHPDLILVGRALYPPEVVGGKKEANEISVEQIRRIVLGRAGFSPHEGRAQVFIIRGAEQLSLSAANALLKTLEEPRPQTHFVLLTDQPERLLDTIRSRTMPVRFGTLTDEHITAILREHEVPEARIGAAVDLADGSAAAALAFADEEGAAARTAFVESVLAAVAAPNLDAAVELGEGLPRDRHQLVRDLQALATAYVQRARRATSAGEGAGAELAARRHALVLDAIDAVSVRNGSAGLVVSTMVANLRHGWQRRPAPKPPIVVTRR